MRACVPKIATRWGIEDDIDDLVVLERDAFAAPWSKDDFRNCLNRKKCMAVVAEIGGKVVGFLLFEAMAKRVKFINMAVHSKHRRFGVGTAMIHWVIDKLLPDKRCLLVAEVRERNLPAQLFMKAAGFRAEQILPDYYADTGESAYEFQLLCDKKSQ